MLKESDNLRGSTVSKSTGHFSITLDSSLTGETLPLMAKAAGHVNTLLQTHIGKNPTTTVKLVMSPYPANTCTVVGSVTSKTTYVIDGKKPITDTTQKQSSDDFKKELLKQHLGTPASEEGSSVLH